MNRLQVFGVFVAFVGLGFYAGNINSSLLGIDLTTAETEIVNLFKISMWAIGFGFLFKMKEVFQ
jgi:hypothetical protein